MAIDVKSMLGQVDSLARFAKFRVANLLRPMSVAEVPMFDPIFNGMFPQLLAQASHYLEFGSGGSTLLAARLGIPTVSVESDSSWARIVSEAVAASPNVQVRHADVGLTRQMGAPVFHRPTSRRLRKWSRYVDAAGLRESETPYDLVLVDGRFRIACALSAISVTLERGARCTLVIDDYEGRSHYSAVQELCDDTFLVGRTLVMNIAANTTTSPTTGQIDTALRDYR